MGAGMRKEAGLSPAAQAPKGAGPQRQRSLQQPVTAAQLKNYC